MKNNLLKNYIDVQSITCADLVTSDLFIFFISQNSTESYLQFKSLMHQLGVRVVVVKTSYMLRFCKEVRVNAICKSLSGGIGFGAIPGGFCSEHLHLLNQFFFKDSSVFLQYCIVNSYIISYLKFQLFFLQNKRGNVLNLLQRQLALNLLLFNLLGVYWFFKKLV